MSNLIARIRYQFGSRNELGIAIVKLLGSRNEEVALASMLNVIVIDPCSVFWLPINFLTFFVSR